MIKSGSKNRFLFTVILIALFQISCFLFSDGKCDEGESKKPSDCNSSIPSGGTVSVSIVTNSINPTVKIEIYEGNIEDGKLIISENLSSDKSYTLPNGYYTAQAFYKVNYEGHVVTIKAVDGKELDYSSQNYCDGTCYSDGSINLDCELSF